VPALTMCALQILLLPLTAGNAQLDRPLPAASTDGLLQYDDGTMAWLCLGDCGVWFDTQDFASGSTGGLIGQLEFWFYHHASYPWPSSSFYAELYNGDEAGPVALLDQTSVTASHFAPCYASYSPMIAVEQNFWGIVNTDMGGYGPTCIIDNTPNFTGSPHSIMNGDWIDNDLFIRASLPNLGLAETTWGSIKTLF
jgi:hypothetical protein